MGVEVEDLAEEVVVVPVEALVEAELHQSLVVDALALHGQQVQLVLQV